MSKKICLDAGHGISTPGKRTPRGVRDLIDMHVCYHDLKGNGLLDNVMRQVKELPIRK